jgi:hypothetical protein
MMPSSSEEESDYEDSGEPGSSAVPVCVRRQIQIPPTVHCAVHCAVHEPALDEVVN